MSKQRKDLNGTARLAPGLALALALAMAGCAVPRDDGPARARSVVLIVADTLRADHTGVYGYSRRTTPNLDAWARRGTIFDNAFSAAPWTLPSFGTLLTGLLPSDHGAGWPTGEGVFSRTGLVGNIATLPLVLARAGFETAGFASNPFIRAELGMARGFEEFSHENGRPADRVADAALSWLHADRDKRFFCMVHFIDPHPPYRAPEPFFGRFAERDPVTFVPHVVSDLPEADRERLIGRYDEEIAFLDQELGRLLDGLDDLDDTLVIFAADHGEEFFDHGSLEHGHTLMQELLRVPLVIVGPGVAARRSAEPVTLADIPLTVLDAAGVDTDLRSENGVVGTSLWPLLTRDEAEPLQPGHARTLFAESKLYGTERKAIVEWPYKLILDPRTGARRLFDLEDDPRERSDLSQGHGEIADRLEATLRQRLLARPPVRGPVEAPEEETKRQLEALGYVN